MNPAAVRPRRVSTTPRELAGALLQQVRSAANAGRILSSIRIAERALARFEHFDGVDDLRLRITVTLSTCYAEIGRADDAFRVLDDIAAVHLAQDGLLEQSRGLLFLRLGQHDAALRALTSVIDGAPDADEVTRCAALVNRGLLHMQLGRLSEAAADTGGAAVLAAGMDDPGAALMTRHNLGYIKFLAGELPAALREMQAAQDAHPGVYIGIPALDRARVLMAAGLRTEARETIDLALADFTVNRALNELADARLVSAELSALEGDGTAARREARRAGALYRRLGNTVAALLADFADLRVRSLAPPRGGAPANAAVADTLSTELAGAGFPEEAAHAQLFAAEAELSEGRPDAAAERVDQASRLTSRTPIDLTLHRRLVQGRIALRTDRTGDGLRILRRGLDDLADFQARFGSQDMQSGAAVHGQQLARLGLRAAVESGSPARVLQWIERARAVSTRLPAVKPPADPELADLLGALRSAANQAREAAVAGGADLELERRVAELRRRVRARSWIVVGSGSAVRPVSLAAAQRLLATDPADPSVVAYLTGDGAVYALVITATAARFRRLADWHEDGVRQQRLVADLDVLAADRVPAPIRAVARASLDGQLGELDADLARPLSALLHGGPVLITAVGDLATLPWALLPSLAGRPVSVSSSVTSAMASAGRPARAHLRGVLSVAGPDVPYGVEEARDVASRHVGAGLLIGDDATGEAVRAQMPAGGLLHVAAHGRHETESPLFSSVQLADGPLYAYDIAPHELPDQVVLSSCDVGRTAVRPGGEALGLAAALLRSGVSTVVTAVSRVSDRLAQQVMAEYHAALIDGSSPAAALAAAVAAVGGPGGEPAAFGCFGAGT